MVNVPNLMLHHPDCDHISDLMTKAAKACADGADAGAELCLWAQKEKGKRLLICETCEARPYARPTPAIDRAGILRVLV